MSGAAWRTGEGHLLLTPMALGYDFLLLTEGFAEVRRGTCGTPGMPAGGAALLAAELLGTELLGEEDAEGVLASYLAAR